MHCSRGTSNPNNIVCYSSKGSGISASTCFWTHPLKCLWRTLSYQHCTSFFITSRLQTCLMLQLGSPSPSVLWWKRFTIYLEDSVTSSNDSRGVVDVPNSCQSIFQHPQRSQDTTGRNSPSQDRKRKCCALPKKERKCTKTMAKECENFELPWRSWSLQWQSSESILMSFFHILLSWRICFVKKLTILTKLTNTFNAGKSLTDQHAHGWLPGIVFASWYNVSEGQMNRTCRDVSCVVRTPNRAKRLVVQPDSQTLGLADKPQNCIECTSRLQAFAF